MKFLILAAAMTLTAASAFAQYNSCEAEMIDNRGRVREVIRAFDCQEAMKQCRIRINDLRMRGVYDCRRIENSPGPQIPGPQNPYPNPYPDTNPYPGPQTGYDANRSLINGESVIRNSTNKYVTVLGGSFNGQAYAVKSTDGWNTVQNGVSRDDLSVTTGCSSDLCVNDSVINIHTAKYVTVAGLSTLGRFVTKSTDGWNSLVASNDRRNLAVTKQGSCAFSRYGNRICIGNQVINQQNRYSTVAGIQLDGSVVLKSTDGWNSLTPNVNPETLVITR